MKWLKKRKLASEATRFGIPVDDRKFWPPIHINFSRDLPYGRRCTTDLYDANIGDVVTVFQDGGIHHRYLLLAVSWAAGDDHIVSPKQFHIRYVESVFVERNDPAEVEHPIIAKMLPLRISESGDTIRTREGVEIRMGYWDDKEGRAALMRYITIAVNARANLLAGRAVMAETVEGWL